MSLNTVKGVGKSTEKRLNKMGITSRKQLQRHFPVRYEKFTYPESAYESEDKIAINGIVIENVDSRDKVQYLYIKDVVSGLPIKLAFFGYHPFLRYCYAGKNAIFYGKVTSWYGQLQMTQPNIFSESEYEDMCKAPLPVYGLTEGIKQGNMRRIVKESLKDIQMNSRIPCEYTSKFMDLTEAMLQIHNPTSFKELDLARKRLSYEELFNFLVSVRGNIEKEKITPLKSVSVEEIISSLPYELTGAQQRSWEEIKTDLCKSTPMSRLLQGDVGTGKTIIALLAMMFVAKNNAQSVLMAPTEVLALQHYNDVVELINELSLPYNVVLLVGSSKGKTDIYDSISSGKTNIIVGTHAVFQKAVEYNNLKLVIVDEQHRFGTLQREELRLKGKNVHVLSMSATPIPRSMGLAMYGNTNVSILDEYPANRKQNKNAVVNASNRFKAWEFIYKKIVEGRQAYIVCPMIDESEEKENVLDYYKKLEYAFAKTNVRIVYLHGRMTSEEKRAIIKDFSMHKYDILISTTVIEVGVNVPNASVMLIEQADQFGLAQLHQLRGRVGRGGHQGYCLFMNSTDEEVERLEVISHTNDGFEIAEADMKMRGLGNLLGEAQSGHKALYFTNLTDEKKVLYVLRDVEDYLKGKEENVYEKNIR